MAIRKMTVSQNPLLEASNGHQTRFELELHSGTLQVNDVVRKLPNRRVVMHGWMDGREVFIKAFLGPSAQRYAERDLAGVRSFQQAGVLTPHLHYQEYSSRYQSWILVFEAVKQANSVMEYYSSHSLQARSNLLKQLSATLAKHHHAGLIQKDMHPNNFLIQKHRNQVKIYCLDGDAVRVFRQLTYAQSMLNLATLLCKFDVLEVNNQLPEYLQSYAKARAWQPFTEPQIQNFRDMMRSARLEMLSQYADKKVFRDCSDVKVQKIAPYLLRLSKNIYTQAEKLIDSLSRAFQQSDYLKRGNTCSVVRYQVNQQSIVIKRYNIKNIWHGLSRGLRASRASLSWGNAHRLNLLGIPTGQPLALIEKRIFGWQLQSYFISRFVPGLSLKDLPQHMNKTQLKQAAEALAELFYRMHLIGISHGDCKADNFKYDQHCWWILDLDSMQQHWSEKRASQAHIRDLKRLFANWKADDTLYNVMLSAFAKRYGNDPVLRMAGLQ